MADLGTTRLRGAVYGCQGQGKGREGSMFGVGSAKMKQL